MALEILRMLGVELLPKTVINIFGQYGVGKSVFAVQVAKEYLPDAPIIIIATEAHYEHEKYKELITRIGGNRVQLNILSAFEYRTPLPIRVLRALYKLRDRILKGDITKGIVILDSLSAMALDDTARLMAEMGTTEPRSVSARVIPSMNAVASLFRGIVNILGTIGIMITHEGSTAGAMKYRGQFDFKPSMARRVGHSIDYEIHIAPNTPDTRVFTLTFSRTTPFLEGAQVLARITSEGFVPIERIERKKKG